MITLFAGSGIRAGATEYLTFDDIFVITEKKEHLPFLKWYKSDLDVLACKFVVYRGEPEEYVTFGTPGIARKVQRYLLEREHSGEVINEQSPVLKKTYPSGEAMSPKCFCMFMERLMEKKRMMDKSISPLHSFRKFYETTVERHTNPLMAERLTGHCVGLGTAEAYIIPSEDELLELFLKCVPDLTLDKVENVERKMKVESEELKQRVDNMEKMMYSMFGKILNLERYSMQRKPSNNRQLSKTRSGGFSDTLG